MTLYEFNRLSENEQLKTVWSMGVFLDDHISKTEMLSCYAIDMFFVEVEYDNKKNIIINKKAFVAGVILNKYSNLK